MNRPFTVLGIIALVCVAALQVARLWLGWAVSIGGIVIVPIASVLIAALALVLAIGLWLEIRREAREADEEPEAAEPRTRSAVRAAGEDQWMDPMTGHRRPARYFIYSANGVPVSSIRRAARKYGRIMVGFDSGGYPKDALEAAREAGAELEIYVEGPGGPTGSAWAPDERERVRRAAQSVGIDTNKRDWMKEEWNTWGWKEYTFRQLESYLMRGFKAAEIDNLYNGLGDDPESYVAFYKEYADRHAAGRLPRLVIKNQSVAQLRRIVAAVKSGELPRAMFSDWHIFELERGRNAKREDTLSSEIGIRTITSTDTYNYAAKGEYNLEDEYTALLPARPAVAAPLGPLPINPQAQVPSPQQAQA